MDSQEPRSPRTPPPESTVSSQILSPNSRAPTRKLQKRPPQHIRSMDFPERLRRSDKDDEQEEDVLPRGAGLGNRPYANMNQSIFGLIAASNVDFHDRFEGHSSEEEEEEEDDANNKTPKPNSDSDHMAQTSILIRPNTRRRSGEHKLMSSVPLLSKLSSKKKRSKKEDKKQPVSKIQEESEPESPIGEDLSSLAPVMSRLLEAHAEAAARPSFDLERPSTEKPGETGPTELSKRLQKIFELEEAEDLISEYPCWLLQSALLQGYIYITTKHICFYSYLPKKAVRSCCTQDSQSPLC